MKLATLRDGSRDGQLAVVSRDLSLAHHATAIAGRLQNALDDWSFIAPQLEDLYQTLNEGRARHAFRFDPRVAMAPLPRAYQWADGSAYVNHVELVRKARGADMPEFVLDRSADVPGWRRRSARSARRHRLPERRVRHRLRGRGGGDYRRRRDRHDAGRRCRSYPAPDAGQRRQLAQPDPGRACQGLRLFPEQAGDCILTRRRDARRTGRCLARRESASAADGALERAQGRRTERGRRHDLRLRAADRARRAYPAPRRRFNHRVRYGVQSRSQSRLLLHR